MVPILSNKLVDVYYESNAKLLVYDWHGMVDFDLGIQTFKTTMQFIQTSTCHFVLHDATKMTGTFTKLNKFMSEEVAPNFEKHGGQRSAMVISSDVFSLFAINQYLKLTKTNKIELKVFQQRAAALKWLGEKMIRITPLIYQSSQ